MKAYPPGTTVFIGDDREIQGYIRRIEWSPRGLLYEIAWWADGKRSLEWFEEIEFATESDKTEFGFANGK